MQSGLRTYLLIGVLFLGMLACKSVQIPGLLSTPQDGFDPASNPAKPAETPEATYPVPPTQPATPSQSYLELEGEWQGSTPDGSTFIFTVAENRIVYFDYTYQIQTNACLASGSFGAALEAEIIDNRFLIDWSSPEGRKLVVRGIFEGEFLANGVIDFEEQNAECGEVKTQARWDALSEFALAAGTELPEPPATAPMVDFTPTPQVLLEVTAIAPPTSQSGLTSGELIEAFFNAINSGDIQAAVSYADENVIFNFGDEINSIGAAELETFLGGSQITYTLTNVKSLAGTIVTFSVKTSDGKIFASSQAIIDKDRIVILSLK